MRPFLLFNNSCTVNHYPIPNEKELIQDLNLNQIFEAMSCKNDFIYKVSKEVILHSSADLNTILYRQGVLKDCIENTSVMDIFYNIASKALKEADLYKEYSRPHFSKIIPVSARVVKAVNLLEAIIKYFEELKVTCSKKLSGFRSRGLISFCNRINENLTDEFMTNVKTHINKLKAISQGSRMIIGGTLGNGLKGTNYVLRDFPEASTNTPVKKKSPKILKSNQILLDNSSLEKSALEIVDAGMIHILRVVNHFVNDAIDFFEALRYEAGFYSGSINLYRTLSAINASVCFPEPVDINERKLAFEGLYDLSMALQEKKKLVDNALEADGKTLFIITGANQGGKSTFLRSIGLAQLLMQCGMFVAAGYLQANVCGSVFTHFTREEDAGMDSGKLEEELLRMNAIIECITPSSMVLFNEPFATTTERDGSKIAEDIILALYECDIKVLFVTHLYEFSNLMLEKQLNKTVFLRAERDQTGRRSFCIKPGEPLVTSFGEDLYNKIVEPYCSIL